MGRNPSNPKEEINRGAWTTEEDRMLIAYIRAHGQGKWRTLPKKAGLKRCGKSCRLRWLNYLRPGIKRGNITYDEEDLIIRLHKLLGNRWSLIAGRLPGRTDNEIKNYWNTRLQKKVRSEQRTAAEPKPESAAQCDAETSMVVAEKELLVSEVKTMTTEMEEQGEEDEWWNRCIESTSVWSSGLNFDFMEDWSHDSLTSFLDYEWFE